MAPSAPSPLEKEDHVRDAQFNKILHGTSAEKRGGMMAMLKKDPLSQKAAVDEYFKHWDNKSADVETEAVRKARRDEYATLTRQYASPFPQRTYHILIFGSLPATIISPLIFMNTAGAPPSTSAASHTGNPSTVPLPDMSTISR